MQNGIRYIITDPSVFTSIERLKQFTNLLHTMQSDLTVKRLEVIIPTLLYDELLSIKQGMPKEKHLLEIFRHWLSFYTKDHLTMIVRSLVTSKEYRDTLLQFFAEFAPVPASGYADKMDRIGEKTIWRDYR